MINTNLANELRGKGVRVTPQRIAVYSYLKQHRTHPTADEIYKAVAAQHPAFSKTTVYNTLKFFVDKGLALEVKIDADRLRFDGEVTRHGHFLCKRCKKVYDVQLEKAPAVSLSGFEVETSDVYLSGVCKDCNLIIKNKK